VRLLVTQTWEQQQEFDDATERLIERARQLAPVLRSRAAQAEALRRQPDETIRDAEEFMNAMVPKKRGGLGLGARVLCEVARELAHGDASAAWTIAFLIEHSWMACRLPVEAQEELFADRSFILASAPLTPWGSAVRVDGGFRVSGTFRYASCVWNSDWTFLSSMVRENGEMVAYTFLIPLSELVINDDWFMSGMAATGSSSVTGEAVFVPERRSIRMEDFFSVDRHHGVMYEETIMRYPPYASLGMMVTAVALGAAEAAVELVRDRLSSTTAFGGTPRIQLPMSRDRWGKAHELVRCAQLLYHHNLDLAIKKCDAGEEWSLEEVGQIELDQTTIVHMAQEAVGIVCDGMGSSPYRTSDPLQRARRDLDVIANHAFMDYDLIAERSVRFVLGLGAGPNDPITTRAAIKSNKR
jgi:alkylation response protein AidB-like acyl-CoA dehydrogenase